MWYFLKGETATIVRRHFFLLSFSIIKFIIASLLAIMIYYIASHIILDNHTLQISLYAIALFIINYAFLRLTLGIIRYYNNLIIICPEQIVIIKSSLLLEDRVESLDSFKIMKLDAIASWYLANIFWYGNLIIEQQNDDLRKFHFMPHPYKVVEKIKSNINTMRKQQNIQDENN